MPDMQYSQAYETYTANPNFEDGRTARKPVEGTIPRGALSSNEENTDASRHNSYLHKRYYDNSPEGYELAGAELVNPIELNDAILKSGKGLYTIYCAVCHGEKGDGRGSIVETGAYPPVPAYEILLTNKPDGKLFHSITYGRNLMGSHSSQLSVEERWTVIHYIKDLTGISTEPVEQTVVADTTLEVAN